MVIVQKGIVNIQEMIETSINLEFANFYKIDIYFHKMKSS